jgi:charged multivesicular body protein 1
MGNWSSKDLEEELIDLRLASKQMQRSAKKCEKNEKAEIEKLKAAIKSGDSERARIHGQSAIREKNQALNHMRMSSRLNAVGSRLETAVRMNQLSGTMKGVTIGMSKGLSTMDVEQLTKVMDKFEKQFEDLDIRTSYIDGAMASTTAMASPIDQVDELIMMVADANNLELGEAFSEIGNVSKKIPPKKEPVQESKQEDDLATRLANLRS